jgi:uncharacterized protein (DUF1697 family)
MTTYVALLRGIMPMNPNMKGEKLREVFESLGFANVATVIASGNVVFDSPSKNVPALETKIEKALPEKLGFKSTTIIRNKEELEKLWKKDPMKKAHADSTLYPIVTFLKKKPRSHFPDNGEGFSIAAAYERELCSVFEREVMRTTDIMRNMEKHYGKEITTRTWKTVGRILKKMER